MPKKKPTHLYKLEDISAPDMLTYQFSLTSGEDGPSELRNLMYKKITELLIVRCGGPSIQTRVVLAGRLTHITVQSDHTEARGCIVDGVAAAYAEHVASVLTDEEKLTTMVTRTVAEFGCDTVTVSYTTTDGWTVHRPDVSLVAGSPVAAIHDASTQSVIIRSRNPLYRIDEETIGRIIEALRASVTKTADVERHRMIVALGGAAMKDITPQRSMVTALIESFEAIPAGNYYHNTSRYYDSDRLQRYERELRPILQKAVPERDASVLQDWERELLGGYHTANKIKTVGLDKLPPIMTYEGNNSQYSLHEEYIYPPGGASKFGY